MKLITALITFLFLIYTLLERLTPDNVDSDTYYFIKLFLHEFRFEILFLIILVTLISLLSKHYKEVFNKLSNLSGSHMLFLSILVIFFYQLNKEDLRLLARARVYYYQKGLVYAKFNQKKADEYIDLINLGNYKDAEKYYEKYIKNKFSENDYRYISEHKKGAEKVVNDAAISFKKYNDFRENYIEKPTRISVPYLYHALTLYPKNAEYRDEFQTLFKIFQSASDSIDSVFKYCMASDYINAYKVFKKNGWYYFDEKSYGYFLNDDDNNEIAIIKTKKLCNYCLKNSEDLFRERVFNSWQLGTVFSNNIKSLDNIDGLQSFISKNAKSQQILKKENTKSENFPKDNRDDVSMVEVEKFKQFLKNNSKELYTLDLNYLKSIFKQELKIDSVHILFELYTINDYSKLVNFTRDLIAKNEGDVKYNSLYLLSGEGLYLLGKMDQAILEYQKVVALGGEFKVVAPLAMYKQAICFERLNDFETSNILLQKLLTVYGDTEFVKYLKNYEKDYYSITK